MLINCLNALASEWQFTPSRVDPFYSKNVLENLNQYIVFCEGVNKMIFISFWSKNSRQQNPVLKSLVKKKFCIETCFMALFQWQFIFSFSTHNLA